jgi:hypothetical protein
MQLFTIEKKKKGHGPAIKRALGNASTLSAKLHPYELIMHDAAKENAEHMKSPRLSHKWSQNLQRGKTHGILQFVHKYADSTSGILVQVYNAPSVEEIGDGIPWYISTETCNTVPEDLRIEYTLEQIKNIYFVLYTNTNRYLFGRYGEIPAEACRLTYRKKSTKKDKLIINIDRTSLKFHTLQDLIQYINTEI